MVNNSKDRTSRNNRNDTHVNSQGLGKHTEDLHKFKFNIGKSHIKIIRQTQSSTINKEATGNWYLLREGNLVFYKGMTLSISTTRQDRPHAKE